MTQDNGHSEFGYLQSDEPIQRREDDQLKRAGLANAIADQVIHGPEGHGFVIAIEAPWGTGKTSVLNMISEAVAENSETVTLRFNPWLFSGTEQLVVRFLQELGAQLGENSKSNERLSKVSESLASYGEALTPLVWVPVAGPQIARAGQVMKTLGRLGKRGDRQPSVFNQRQQVRKALEGLDRRVLVIVDDIDRIESEQVRDVVRLIKLVADFPNVTYLLAYDGEVIARALGRDARSGRDYLEKIVQVTHHLPEIDEWSLVKLLQTELDAAIAPIECGPFSRDDWVNVFHTGMRPFFGNVRDVRRYLNSVPVTLRVVGDEVALVDALALETLRVFVPEAWAMLPAMVATLTGEGIDDYGGSSREREERDQSAIDAFVAAAAPHEEPSKQLIARLFPRAGRYVETSSIVGGSSDYRRNRRVADPGVLRYYLRRALPEGTTPARLVQQAYESMGNRARFTELLESLDQAQLEDLLERLEDYEQEFDPGAAEVAAEVLLNQLVRLREGQRGMLDFGANLKVTRVVLRILRRIGDPQETLELIRRILPRLNQLSARLELIDLVGHRENVGHGLVPEPEGPKLYEELYRQVLEASPQVLAKERELDGLLYRMVGDAGDERRALVHDILSDDRVLLRLLRASYGESRSQTVGDLAVRSVPTLPWEPLADLIGGEERLKERIGELASHRSDEELDERTKLALDAAERYAKGELPPKNRYH